MFFEEFTQKLKEAGLPEYSMTENELVKANKILEDLIKGDKTSKEVDSSDTDVLKSSTRMSSKYRKALEKLAEKSEVYILELEPICVYDIDDLEASVREIVSNYYLIYNKRPDIIYVGEKVYDMIEHISKDSGISDYIESIYTFDGIKVMRLTNIGYNEIWVGKKKE